MRTAMIRTGIKRSTKGGGGSGGKSSVVYFPIEDKTLDGYKASLPELLRQEDLMSVKVLGQIDWFLG
ncbi:hypothetical protein ACFX13_014761 [Malus domestica]